MPLLIAALDADVLVPIAACDFLLTAFDLGLYEPVVSTVVIDDRACTHIYLGSCGLARRS